MTPLKKRVTRECIDGDWRGRKLVVSLAPGDIIEVREKGRRQTFAAPISWVATQIIKMNVDAERAKRSQRRAVKRGLL